MTMEIIKRNAIFKVEKLLSNVSTYEDKHALVNTNKNNSKIHYFENFLLNVRNIIII